MAIDDWEKDTGYFLVRHQTYDGRASREKKQHGSIGI